MIKKLLRIVVILSILFLTVPCFGLSVSAGKGEITVKLPKWQVNLGEDVKGGE